MSGLRMLALNLASLALLTPCAQAWFWNKDDASAAKEPIADLDVARSLKVMIYDPKNIERVAEVTDVVRQKARDDEGNEVTIKGLHFQGVSTEGFGGVLRDLGLNGGSPTNPEGDQKGIRVFNQVGEKIENFMQIKEGDSLYVVPSKRSFIWPAVELGHNVSLDFMGDVSNRGAPPVLETLSLHPRVFKIHNFLSEEEVDQLVAKSKKMKLSISTSGMATKDEDPEKGENKGQIRNDRTSTNTWDTSSPLAVKLHKRSFELIRQEWNPKWLDGFQIVKYDPGQFYNSHNDFFELNQGQPDINWSWDTTTDAGTNRMATVFLYLSDAELGGATVFPRSDTVVEEDMSTREEAHKIRQQLVDEGKITKGGLEWNLIDECRQKFHMPAKKGDAVLFYHMDARGVLDRNAQHAACPLLKGEKWGANLWLWHGIAYDEQIANAHKPEYQGFSVNFVSQMKTQIRMFYKDGSSNLHFQAYLNPNEPVVINTYHLHKFAFTNLENENILHEVTMNYKKKTYDISFDSDLLATHDEL